MSGHTPGPWTQDDTHGRRFIEQVGTGEAVAIACKVDGKDGWKTMNANASLIAAAPSLLEDLIIAVGAIREICHVRGVPLPNSTLERADRSIARAKGESQ